MTIRQPIITVAGHVDHGKTSILDALRGTKIADGEAGSITQKISFTKFPVEQLKKVCPLIEKSGIKLVIPGFLFIDTPGHAAFNNLRKRGGSLADIAILVIDINEGIKPQTAEVLQILKEHKTPFIIALNKIDRIRGWQKLGGNLKENINSQQSHVKQDFDEKYYTIVGALNSYGFQADLFYNIEDFSKNIALVPCSAHTKEGIPEILFVMAGLSQRFLMNQLEVGDVAKGVVLEIKKENNLSYIESILYDGSLKINDEIAIASFDGFIKTRVKSIQEIEPLSFKFKSKEIVSAASGIRMQINSKDEILPGMPFMLYTSEEEVKENFKSEIFENIKTDKKGIIIKADSLGSLEAMIVLLQQTNVPIVKAGIGTINKSDVLSAKANLNIDPLDAIILGFNVSIGNDVPKFDGIKIISHEVIYKIIEDLQEYREKKTKEIEKERLMELASICKLEILHQYVFRNTSPAIFGVRVSAGELTENQELIDDSGDVIGRVKRIQLDNKGVSEALQNMEVAISMSGVNFERKLGDKKNLYSNISEKQFKKFKENRDLLSSDEIKVLQELKVMKEWN